MTTERVFNFSAGPAVMPESVLRRAQEELLGLPGVGSSVMEISHRSSTFVDILETAKADLTELLSIPDDYEVLFLQGGSRLQFSMIPMNLLRGQNKPADYIVTGSWGAKARDEAKKEGEVNVAWDGRDNKFSQLPADTDLKLSSDPAYVYYTSNETIQGIQFPTEPASGGAPLICDASSDIMWRPTPIEKHGLLYACAQKNAGPAGVTLVIIRKDLLARGSDDLPGYLNYREHVANNSLYNTPPTFAIYLLGLIAKWLKDDIGGLAKMEEINRRKAALLYDAMDASDGFYNGHAATDCRSIMNVTFKLASDDLQEKFIAGAAQQALVNLKGHRSVGGIRASIYNAMPEEGVAQLAQYMRDFRGEHAS